MGATLAEQVSRCVAGRQRDEAKRAAASPAGRRHTNSQIARQLGTSEGTRAQPPGNIYERLQVSSRTAAVTHALADRVA
jgi:DNA-binding CsgD family transcriptional regulator